MDGSSPSAAESASAVAQNRLHIELALLASQWLGRAVLRPGAPPGAGLPRAEG